LIKSIMIITVLLKLKKDFSRSKIVTYHVKVVISLKQGKMETLLLHIANRK